MAVTGILLAAGNSTRFSGHKLCAPLTNNVPIGLQAAQQLKNGVDEILVVLKPNDHHLSELFSQHHFPTTVCQSAHLGMSESLKAGLNASSSSEAWLIALADMPFIQTETIKSLAKHLQDGNKIVCPTYLAPGQTKPQRGHPVGFSREFFEELQALSGDKGAREILQRHPELISELPCEDKGIITDIDTRQQWEDFAQGIF